MRTSYSNATENFFSSITNPANSVSMAMPAEQASDFFSEFHPSPIKSTYLPQHHQNIRLSSDSDISRHNANFPQPQYSQNFEPIASANRQINPMNTSLPPIFGRGSHNSHYSQAHYPSSPQTQLPIFPKQELNGFGNHNSIPFQNREGASTGGSLQMQPRYQPPQSNRMAESAMPVSRPNPIYSPTPIYSSPPYLSQDKNVEKPKVDRPIWRQNHANSSTNSASQDNSELGYLQNTRLSNAGSIVHSPKIKHRTESFQDLLFASRPTGNTNTSNIHRFNYNKEARPTRGIMTKGRYQPSQLPRKNVKFNNEVNVIVVENWKILNVDISRRKKDEHVKRDFCFVF